MTTHISPPAPMDSAYPLTQDHVEQYRRDGRILVRGVASPEEVESFRGRLSEAIEAVAARKDPQKRIEDYTGLFLQVTNVWRPGERLVLERGDPIRSRALRAGEAVFSPTAKQLPASCECSPAGHAEQSNRRCSI